MALADTTIKKFKAADKTYSITDGLGLSMEVPTKGAKRWRFRYRFDGKAKVKSLGIYPDVSLADARKKRDDARSTLATYGIDPFAPVIADKEVVQQERTFKEWSELYIEQILSSKSEAHQTRTIKGFKKDVYNNIGSTYMSEIKPKHIIAIMKKMGERGVYESAKKVLGSISIVFKYAINNEPDLYDNNPCDNVDLTMLIKVKPREHYPIIIDDKSLGDLMVGIREYTGFLATSQALLFLAYTAVRPANARYRYGQKDLVYPCF